MRLDKYLKVSRLIKRRTVANEVTAKGRVSINGKVAKPSSEVKEGDKLKLEYYNKTLIAEVVKVPARNVSIQESKTLYKVIQEIHKNNEGIS